MQKLFKDRKATIIFSFKLSSTFLVFVVFILSKQFFERKLI